MPGRAEVLSAVPAGERASVSQELLGLPQVWKATTGAGITVGVVDSGIDETHHDLAGALRADRSLVGASARKDALGHGTHVAGIIAARENRKGIIGVAPGCDLLSARIADRSWTGVDATRAAEAIAWCVEEGADVICLSLAWAKPDPALDDAVTAAAEQGVFCVCAAGNKFEHNGHVGFPASHPDAISVGSAFVAANTARPADDSPTKGRVDLYAPGVGIVSTYPGNRYARWSGTSMAAPFVAGAIALLLAHRAAANLPRPARDQLLQQLRRNGSIAESAGLPRRVINPRHVTDHA